jgi:putative PIN family toxin of toxin-antitoxin system
VRAVLDPNVLVLALLSRTSAPAQTLQRWLAGGFELVVSESLLLELSETLSYPKLRSRPAAQDAEEFVALLRTTARLAADPAERPQRSPDPGDDYLLALAGGREGAPRHRRPAPARPADRFPIETPRAFLDRQ